MYICSYLCVSQLIRLLLQGQHEGEDRGDSDGHRRAAGAHGRDQEALERPRRGRRHHPGL